MVLDLQCKTSDNRRIVVEMQKRPQTYFRARSLYYATWPIHREPPGVEYIVEQASCTQRVYIPTSSSSWAGISAQLVTGKQESLMLGLTGEKRPLGLRHLRGLCPIHPRLHGRSPIPRYPNPNPQDDPRCGYPGTLDRQARIHQP